MDHAALLKTLLQELNEGVIVCAPDAGIDLFNRAAEELFGHGPARLSRGKSLFSICHRAPVEQAVNLLRYQQGLDIHSGPLPYVQFLNATLDRKQYFRCRVSLLPPTHESKNSFIVTFEDISAWYVPDNPLFMKIEEFRAPMTNLRAAVENLTEYPEMSPVMRSAFENVLVQESLNLTEAFDALAGSCHVLMQTQNHLTELNTDILFGYAAKSLLGEKIPLTPSAEQSVIVRVDIYGLLLVLGFLARSIQQNYGEAGLSCEAHIGEQFIYFDLIWQGEPPASGAVKMMLEEKMEHCVGGMTVAAILQAMEGDIWSQRRKDSTNTLRLALPIAQKAGS